MTGSIFWLASYPKSGNTWLRVVLTNYLRDPDRPVDINDLEGGPIASARTLFDEAVGVKASDLTAEEIDRYRPDVYRYLAAQSEETRFMKIHDAWTRNTAGLPLFPADITKGAIYVLRNPLDVAVSLAHQNHMTLDTTIARMADACYAFDAQPNQLSVLLRQGLLTWSGHVMSWVRDADFPVHVMRYEDMLCQPQATFAAAMRFAGLPNDTARLHKALTFSHFALLQAQEYAHGFKEKPATAAVFFRQGTMGAWRDVLTNRQMARLIRDHGEVMRRFGYLNEAGEVVC